MEKDGVKMKKIIFGFIIFVFAFQSVNANVTEDNLNSLKEEIKELKTKANSLNSLDEKYPIGSIYITTTATNPSLSLGGTWEAYGQGRTLIGMGNNGTTNYQTISSTGGISKMSLSIDNIPAHSHTLTAKGSVTSTFTGEKSDTIESGSHNHIISASGSGDEVSGYAAASCDGPQGFSGRVIVMHPTLGYYTSNDGLHSHTVTPKGTVTSTFAGTSKSTSSSGSTSSFSVQNPYITTYFWKRTK